MEVEQRGKRGVLLFLALCDSCGIHFGFKVWRVFTVAK